MAVCDIDQLLADANTNRFTQVSESTQRALLLELLCSISAGGGGGAAAWGGITGTLSNQTDLQTALNAKLALTGGQLTGNLTFSPDNTLDIGASGATRPRRGYFGTEVVAPLFTGALTGASSLNVLKAGDTMTGLLTIANATANTSNLVLSGQSLTGANAQSLLSMAGTWNTSGNPSALRLSITDTASGATSKFLEFLGGAAGATAMANITKFGQIQAGDGASALTVGTPGLSFVGAPQVGFRRNLTTGAYFTASGADIWFSAASSISMRSNGNFSFSSGADPVGPLDIILFRDAAGTLAQRVTTTAQTFRLYRTWTDASNYERLALQTAAGQMILAAETAGTGTDDLDLVLTPAGVGRVTLPGGAVLLKTTGALTDGGAAATGTLTNAPAAGNPTKWLAINDGGTIRHIPAW